MTRKATKATPAKRIESEPVRSTEPVLTDKLVVWFITNRINVLRTAVERGSQTITAKTSESDSSVTYFDERRRVAVDSPNDPYGHLYELYGANDPGISIVLLIPPRGRKGKKSEPSITSNAPALTRHQVLQRVGAL